MAKKPPYSDNVKSAIYGAVFTTVVLGFIMRENYVRSEASRIYQEVDGAISELDGKKGTSITDWNMIYQRALGRELKLGEHPLESGLEDLIIIENNLPKIISDKVITQIK